MIETQNKIVEVSKEIVDTMISKLATRISLDSNNFDYVVGIECGGLNVSVPLAKMLNLPHKSVKISFYNKENKANSIPTVNLNGNIFNQKDRVLVVDDLIDDGHTVKYFIENIICQYKIAVLYWNKDGKYNIKPDYYVEEKFSNTWLEFYWEKQ